MAHEHNEPEPSDPHIENGNAETAISATSRRCPELDFVLTDPTFNTHYKNGQTDRVDMVFSLQRVIDRCSTIELLLKRLYRRAKGENAQEQPDIPMSD